MNSLAFDNIKSATVFIFPSQEEPDRVEIEFSVPTPYSLTVSSRTVHIEERIKPSILKFAFPAPHGTGKDYVQTILQITPTIKDLSTCTQFDEDLESN